MSIKSVKKGLLGVVVLTSMSVSASNMPKGFEDGFMSGTEGMSGDEIGRHVASESAKWNPLGWGGKQRDECSIWLCLPMAFSPSACSAARSAWLKRIKPPRPKSPLPSWSSCSTSASGVVNGVPVSVGTQGQPYTTHKEFTDYIVMLDKAPLTMVRTHLGKNIAASKCPKSGVIYSSYGNSNLKDKYKRIIGYCSVTVTTVFNVTNNFKLEGEAKKAYEELTGRIYKPHSEAFKPYEEKGYQWHGKNISNFDGYNFWSSGTIKSHIRNNAFL